MLLEGNRRITIGELVEQKFSSNQTYKLDDGYISYFDGLKVASIKTDTNKLGASPIIAYIKRKTPKKLILIRTESGLDVTVTPYHPLFVLSGNKLTPIKSKNLTKGLPIAVSNNSPVSLDLNSNSDGDLGFRLDKIKLIKHVIGDKRFIAYKKSW